jgi:hypothetical protein
MLPQLLIFLSMKRKPASKPFKKLPVKRTGGIDFRVWIELIVDSILKLTEKGLEIIPPKGKNVSVHYRGMLLDGTVFDSSYQRNEPIVFPLGLGQVIKGWDEGIALLKKGSVAKFLIPSELAYGSGGAGGVNSSRCELIFEVELVDILDRKSFRFVTRFPFDITS